MKTEEYFRILILSTFILGLILNPLLKLVGLTILGVDYLIWGLLFLQMFIIILQKKGFKFTAPKNYLWVFSIIVLFMFLNYFNSEYVTNTKWYLTGLLFTLIIPITFLISYNISLGEKSILTFINSIVISLTIILVLIYFESFLIHQSFETLHSSYFLKNNGFVGTLGSLNIAFALVLYRFKKKRKYLAIIIFSFATIIFASLLKSLITSLLATTFFFLMFNIKTLVNRMLLIIFMVFGFIAIISFVGSVQNKYERYIYLYVQSSQVLQTPRIALYVTSFKIARDEFPFGSGQGTFGSFPVNITYSNVYYDYNLSNMHGLKQNSKPNYLLDAYWASVIGEMGLICSFFYIFLHLYPMLYSRKQLKDKELAPFAFIILSTTFIIVIESIALAIPYQVSFIIIYASLNGIIFRFIKNNRLSLKKL